MDPFDLIEGADANRDNLSYTQMTEADIRSYFADARSFFLADHAVSSIHAVSFLNHLYTLAGQSGRAIVNPALNR